MHTQVGERLGRYEVEKRCAVEKEDYDLAKHKKRQMEEYRARVYSQLELHSLVDTELVPRPLDLPPQPLAQSSSSYQLLPPQEDRVTDSLLEQPSSNSLDMSSLPCSSDQQLSSTHSPGKARVRTQSRGGRSLRSGPGACGGCCPEQALT